MIFIATTDLHLASAPPKSRIDADFPEELFELLEQLLDVAAITKAKAILFPGDITHVRARFGWDVFARFLAWCYRAQKAGTDVIGIPGNHDLYLNRYDTLPNTPLGLAFSTNAMTNVSVTQGEHTITYHAEGEQTVAVEGVPFPDAFDLDKWRSLNPGIPGTQRIVLGHCFANLMPAEFYGDPVHGYAELLEASGADYIVLGHDHTDRGVHKFEGDRWVLDVGALSRGSISADNVARELKFSVIDTVKRDVQQYRFHFRPASAIFDLDAKAKLVEETTQVHAFIEQLQRELHAQQGSSTVEDKLGAMSLPSEVRDRVLRYIAEAEQVQDDQLAG